MSGQWHRAGPHRIQGRSAPSPVCNKHPPNEPNRKQLLKSPCLCQGPTAEQLPQQDLGGPGESWGNWDKLITLISQEVAECCLSDEGGLVSLMEATHGSPQTLLIITSAGSAPRAVSPCTVYSRHMFPSPCTSVTAAPCPVSLPQPHAFPTSSSSPISLPAHLVEMETPSQTFHKLDQPISKAESPLESLSTSSCKPGTFQALVRAEA